MPRVKAQGPEDRVHDNPGRTPSSPESSSEPEGSERPTIIGWLKEHGAKLGLTSADLLELAHSFYGVNKLEDLSVEEVADFVRALQKVQEDLMVEEIKRLKGRKGDKRAP